VLDPPVGGYGSGEYFSLCSWGWGWVGCLQ
jgi:hypothetical protein